MSEPYAYTVDECCQALRLSRSKLYGLWEKGTGPKYVRIDGNRIITRKAVDAYVAELESQVSA